MLKSKKKIVQHTCNTFQFNSLAVREMTSVLKQYVDTWDLQIKISL